MLYCLLSSFSAIEHNFHYILVEYSTASNPSHMFFLNSKAIHLFGSMGICRREAKAKLNTTRVEKLDSCPGFRSPGLNRVHVKKVCAGTIWCVHYGTLITVCLQFFSQK